MKEAIRQFTRTLTTAVPRTRWALVLACAGALAGCSSEIEIDEGAPVSVSSEPFTSVGTIFHDGMKLQFDRMNAAGLSLASTVGLTACDAKALYAVRQDAGSLALLFSNDAGESFKVVGTVRGKELACDHGMLATLASDGTLWTAPTNANGTVGSWTSRGQAREVDRLQGGDGTFYGVKTTSSGNKVFVASNRAIQFAPDWSTSIATIGAVLVTGVGGTITGSDGQAVANRPGWPRRAFALEANGQFSYNDRLLDGVNTWRWMNTGNERYLTLSAAATSAKTAPNVLFGLQRRSNGQLEVNRIRITENDCDDGVDNDANGLVDAEDAECEDDAASAWCASHANGDYCSSRYSNDWSGGVLVRCVGGEADALFRGVCEQRGANQDRLIPFNDMNVSLPNGYAYWCNTHRPNGSWELKLGSTSCADLTAAGGTIVRAGVYSVAGKNQVFANCGNFQARAQGNGPSPVTTVKANAEGKQKCVFTISPDKLPVFDKMFNPGDEVPPPRKTNGFTHDTGPNINRFGQACDANNPCIGEPAYDHPLNEGRPLYAVAPGRVVGSGSRDRDLTTVTSCGGTPNQGEIYIEHNVGPVATYRESFVTAYAHLRKRLVRAGQTVKAGQIIGYVGGSGCTGGYSHLHTGVFRLTNVNAQKTDNPAFGYQLNSFFRADANDPSGNNMGHALAIDALAWAGPGEDPWAYTEANTPDTARGFVGLGAWSLDLFKPGAAFDYP